MKGRRAGVLFLLPAALILFMAHTSAKIPDAAQHTAPAKNAGKERISAESSKWVESTLQKMSVDEKIGQLLFTTYHGSLTPTDAVAYAQIMHDVTDLHCGGFINITQASPLGINRDPGTGCRARRLHSEAMESCARTAQAPEACGQAGFG